MLGSGGEEEAVSQNHPFSTNPGSSPNLSMLMLLLVFPFLSFTQGGTKDKKHALEQQVHQSITQRVVAGMEYIPL